MRGPHLGQRGGPASHDLWQLHKQLVVQVQMLQYGRRGGGNYISKSCHRWTYNNPTPWNTTLVLSTPNHYIEERRGDYCIYDWLQVVENTLVSVFAVYDNFEQAVLISSIPYRLMVHLVVNGLASVAYVENPQTPFPLLGPFHQQT